MAEPLDEQVVELRFDNQNFETNVNQSINTINRLKQSLNFDDAGSSFESITTAAAGCDMEPLENSLDQVTSKFSILENAASVALGNIMTQAINAGASIVKSLTVDQVSAGWSKYERKTQSVQTIMAATGASIDTVSKKLDKLMWYADETSYDFVDMVNNIGKFTSAGVDLDTAVNSMMGISNWAAISGAGIQQASRAMYNLSQSIGMGYVGVTDWRSIELANMATLEFKETAIQTAVALGQLQQDASGTIRTLSGMEVTSETMRNTLKDKWFTSDVLNATLEEYSSFANEVKAYQEKNGIDNTRDAMKEMAAFGLVDTNSLGYQSFSKAQEAITYTQSLAATADAVSSSWMTTFELIFGNYEQATELWSGLTDAMWDIFAQSGYKRNEWLSELLSSNLQNFLDALSDGQDFSDRLYNKLYDITKENLGQDVANALLTTYTSLEDLLKNANIYDSTLQTGVEQVVEDYLSEASNYEKLVNSLTSGEITLKNVAIRLATNVYDKDDIESLGFDYETVLQYANAWKSGIQIDWNTEQTNLITSLQETVNAYKKAAEEIKNNTLADGFFGSLKELSGRDKLIGGISNVLGTIKNIYMSLTTMFDYINGGVGIWSTLIDVFYRLSEVFTLLVKPFEELNDILNGYEENGVHYAGIFEIIGTSFHEYIETLPNRAQEVINDIKSKVERIRNEFSGFIDRIFGEKNELVLIKDDGSSETVIKRVGGLLEELKSKVLTFATILVGVLIAPAGLAVASIFTIISKLIGKTKDGASKLSKAFDFIYDKLSAFWKMLKDIGKKTKGLFDGIKNGKVTISDVFSYVQNEIVKLSNIVSKKVSNIFKSVSSTISALMQKVSSKISTSIVPILKSIAQKVKSALLSAFFSVKNSTISKKVSNIFKSISSIISVLMQKVKSALLSAFFSVKNSTISKKVSNIFKSVSSTISALMQKVSSKISTSIVPILQSIAQKVKSVLSSIFSSSKIFNAGAIEQLRSIFSSLVNKINSSPIKTFINTIKKEFNDFWNSAPIVGLRKLFFNDESQEIHIKGSIVQPESFRKRNSHSNAIVSKLVSSFDLDGTKKQLNTFTTYLDKYSKKIIDVLKKVWNFVKKNGDNIIDFAVAPISEKLETLTNVIAKVNKKFSEFKSYIKGLFSGDETGETKSLGSLETWLATAKEKIENIGELLYSISNRVNLSNLASNIAKFSLTLLLMSRIPKSINLGKIGTFKLVTFLDDFVDGLYKLSDAFIKMVGALVVLTIYSKLMARETKTVLSVALIISGMILTLGLMFKMIGGVEIPKSSATALTGLAGAVSALTNLFVTLLILFKVAKFSPGDVIAAALLIDSFIIFIGVSIRLMTRVVKDQQKISSSSGALLSLAVTLLSLSHFIKTLSLVFAAVYLFTKGKDISEFGTAIKLVLYGIAAIGLIFRMSKSLNGSTGWGMVGVAAALAVILLSFKRIYSLADEIDWKYLAVYFAGMAIIMGGLSLLLKTIGTVRVNKETIKSVASLVSMIATIVGLSIAITYLLGQIPSLPNISDVTSFTVVLGSIIAAFISLCLLLIKLERSREFIARNKKLLKQNGLKDDLLKLGGGLLILAGVLALTFGAFWAFSKIKVPSVTDIAKLLLTMTGLIVMMFPITQALVKLQQWKKMNFLGSVDSMIAVFGCIITISAIAYLMMNAMQNMSGLDPVLLAGYIGIMLSISYAVLLIAKALSIVEKEISNASKLSADSGSFTKGALFIAGILAEVALLSMLIIVALNEIDTGTVDKNYIMSKSMLIIEFGVALYSLLGALRLVSPVIKSLSSGKSNNISVAKIFGLIGSLTVIVGLAIALIWALNKISPETIDKNYVAAQSVMIIEFGASLYLLVGALKLITPVFTNIGAIKSNSISFKSFGKLIGALSLLAIIGIALIAALGLLNKLSFVNSDITSKVIMIIEFGVALYLLVGAIRLIAPVFNDISKIKSGSISWTSFGVLVGILVALALLAVGLTAALNALGPNSIDQNYIASKSAMIIEFGVALYLLVGAIRLIAPVFNGISKIKSGSISWTSFGVLVGILGILAVLAGGLTAALNGLGPNSIDQNYIASKSAMVIEFGAALYLLVGAIRLIAPVFNDISKIKSGSISWTSFGVLVSILGALALLAVGLTAALNALGPNSIDQNYIASKSAMIIEFGVALYLLVGAIRLIAPVFNDISKIGFKSISWTSFGVLVSILGALALLAVGLTAALNALGPSSIDQNYIASKSAMIIEFGVALYLLVGAIRLIAPVFNDISKIGSKTISWTSFGVLVGILGVLALLSGVLTAGLLLIDFNQNGEDVILSKMTAIVGFGAILYTLVGAVRLLIPAIKEISSINADSINVKSLLIIAGFLAVLAVCAIGLMKASTALPEFDAKSTAELFIALAGVSVLLLGVAKFITIFNSESEKILEYDAAGLFARLFIVSAVLGMLGIAGYLIIQAVNKWDLTSGLGDSLAFIGYLAVLSVLLIFLVKSLEQIQETAYLMNRSMGGMRALATAAVLVTLYLAYLSALVIGISYAVKLFNDDDISKLAVFTGFIVAFAAIFIGIMAGLNFISKLESDTDMVKSGGTKKILQLIAIASGIVVLLSGFILLLNAIVPESINTLGIANFLGAVAVLTLLLFGISALVVLFGKFSKDLKTNNVKNLAAIFGIAIGIIALVSATIFALNALMPENIDIQTISQFLGTVGILTTLLFSISAVVILFGKFSKNLSANNVKNLAGIFAIAFGIIITISGYIILLNAVLDKTGTNMSGVSTFMQILAQVTGIFLILSAVVGIIGKFTGTLNITGTASIFAIAMGVLIIISGFIIGLSALLQHVDVDVAAITGFLPIVVKVMAVLTGIAAVVGVFGVLATILPGVAVAGGLFLGAVLLIVTIIVAAVAGLGLLAKDIDKNVLGEENGLLNSILYIGEIISAVANILGTALGSFIGSLGESLTGSLPAIAENLCLFISALQPFIDSIGNLNETHLKGAGMLAAIMAAVFCAELFEVLTVAISKLGDTEQFKTVLENLRVMVVDDLTPFLFVIGTLGDNVIDDISNFNSVMKSLVKLSFLNAINEIVSSFGADNNLGTAISNLNAMASGPLKTFLDTAKKYGTEEQFQAIDNFSSIMGHLVGLTFLTAINNIVSSFGKDGAFVAVIDNLKDIALTKLPAFIKAASTIDESDLTAVENFNSLMGKICGAEFLTKITEIISGIGDDGSNISDIVSSLSTAYTKSIAPFLKKVKTIKESDVTAAGYFSDIMNAILGATFYTGLSAVIENMVGAESFETVFKTLTNIIPDVKSFVSASRKITDSDVESAGRFSDVMNGVLGSTVFGSLATVVTQITQSKKDIGSVFTSLNKMVSTEDMPKFLKTVNKLTSKDVEGTATFSSLMGNVLGGAFLGQIAGNIQYFGQDGAIETIGLTMSTLVTNMSTFLDKAPEITKSHADGAAYLASILGSILSITARGKLSSIVNSLGGDTDFASFNDALVTLADGLNKFYEKTKDTDLSHLSSAMSAMETMFRLLNSDILKSGSFITGGISELSVGTVFTTLLGDGASKKGIVDYVNQFTEATSGYDYTNAITAASLISVVLNTLSTKFNDLDQFVKNDSRNAKYVESTVTWISGTLLTKLLDLQTNGAELDPQRIIDIFAAISTVLGSMSFGDYYSESYVLWDEATQNDISSVLTYFSDTLVPELIELNETIAGEDFTAVKSLGEALSAILAPMSMDPYGMDVDDIQKKLASIREMIVSEVELLNESLAEAATSEEGSALTTVLASIKNLTVDLESFQQIGNYVVDGLLIAFRDNNNNNAVYNAAFNLGMNIKKGLMDATEEQSPSKVAYRIAKFVGTGLCNGLKDSSWEVEKAATMLGLDLNRSLNKTLTAHEVNMIEYNLSDENHLNMPDFSYINRFGEEAIDYGKMLDWMHEKFDDSLDPQSIDNFVGSLQAADAELGHTIEDSEYATLMSRIANGDFGFGQDNIIEELTEFYSDEADAVGLATQAFEDYIDVINNTIKISKNALKQKKENPPMTYEQYMEMLQKEQEGWEKLNSGELHKLAVQNGTTWQEEATRLGYSAGNLSKLAYSNYIYARDDYENLVLLVMAEEDLAEKTKEIIPMEEFEVVSDSTIKDIEDTTEAVEELGDEIKGTFASIDDTKTIEVSADTSSLNGIDQEVSEEEFFARFGTSQINDISEDAVIATEAAATQIDDTLDSLSENAEKRREELIAAGQVYDDPVWQNAFETSLVRVRPDAYTIDETAILEDIYSDLTAGNELSPDQYSALKDLFDLFNSGAVGVGNGSPDKAKQLREKYYKDLDENVAQYFADAFASNPADYKALASYMKTTESQLNKEESSVEKATKSTNSYLDTVSNWIADSIQEQGIDAISSGTITLDATNLAKELEIETSELSDVLGDYLTSDGKFTLDLSSFIDDASSPSQVFSLLSSGSNWNKIFSFGLGDVTGSTGSFDITSLTDVFAMLSNSKTDSIFGGLITKAFKWLAGNVNDLANTAEEKVTLEVDSSQVDSASVSIKAFQKQYELTMDSTTGKPLLALQAYDKLLKGEKRSLAENLELLKVFDGLWIGTYSRDQYTEWGFNTGYIASQDRNYLSEGVDDTQKYIDEVKARMEAGEYSFKELMEDSNAGLFGETSVDRKKSYTALGLDADKAEKKFQEYLVNSEDALYNVADDYAQLTDAQQEAKEKAEQYNDILNTTPEGAFRAISDFLSGVNQVIEDPETLTQFNAFMNDAANNLAAIQIPNASEFEKIGNFLSIIRTVTTGSSGISADFGVFIKDIVDELNGIEINEEAVNPIIDFFTELSNAINSLDGSGLSDFLNAFYAGITGSTSQAGSAANTIANTILAQFYNRKASFVLVGNYIVKWIADGIIANAAQAIDAANTLITNILATFSTSLSSDDAVTKVSDAFNTLFTNLLGDGEESAQEGAKKGGSSLSETLDKFGTGIVDSMVQSFTNPDNAKLIQNGLSSLFGLTENEDGSKGALATITDSFSTLTDGITQITSALDTSGAYASGAAMATGIAAGVTDNIGICRAAGGALRSAFALPGYSDGFYLGMMYALGYAQGIASGGAGAYGAGFGLGNASIEGTTSADGISSPSKVARKLGSYFGQGYTLGIQSENSSAYDAGVGIAEASLSGVADAAGIHSPAKKTKKQGGFMGEGFVEGIRAWMDKVNKTASTMALGAINSIDGTFAGYRFSSVSFDLSAPTEALDEFNKSFTEVFGEDGINTLAEFYGINEKIKNGDNAGTTLEDMWAGLNTDLIRDVDFNNVLSALENLNDGVELSIEEITDLNNLIYNVGLGAFGSGSLRQDWFGQHGLDKTLMNELVKYGSYEKYVANAENAVSKLKYTQDNIAEILGLPTLDETVANGISNIANDPLGVLNGGKDYLDMLSEYELDYNNIPKALYDLGQAVLDGDFGVGREREELLGPYYDIVQGLAEDINSGKPMTVVDNDNLKGATQMVTDMETVLTDIEKSEPQVTAVVTANTDSATASINEWAGTSAKAIEHTEKMAAAASTDINTKLASINGQRTSAVPGGNVSNITINQTNNSSKPIKALDAYRLMNGSINKAKGLASVANNKIYSV